MKNLNKEIYDVSTWLRDYAEKAGVGGYVVGLSGGVDSAVVAALAVNAVGNENVIGVIMPIESTLADQEDAILVANTLNIRYDIVNMSTAFKGMMNAYPAHYEENNLRLRAANVKARLRMTMLYEYAGDWGYLVAGTGNKSEDMIGYFTKYGDGGVDVLPIVEFYKHEIREMAVTLGLPKEIAYRTSTAGLWEGQTDENDLGMSYDVIDAILYYLETGEEYPINHADKIDEVKSLIKKNKHKNEYPPSYRRN